MKLIKQVLTLIGVMALMAANLITGNVAAQSIETTLTVDTSAPVCDDPKTSSISFRSTTPGGGFFFSAAGITPTNPPSTTIAVQNNATNLDYYISDCLKGQQWNAYLSIPNFISGTNTLPSIGTISVRGHSNANFARLFLGGTTTVYTGTDAKSNMTTAWVPYTGTPIHLAEGTGTRLPPGPPSTLPGGFSQNIHFGISNIPSNQAPGTYVSTIRATLTVAAP